MDPVTMPVSLDMIALLRNLWVNEPLLNHAMVLAREHELLKDPVRQESYRRTQEDLNTLVKMIESDIIYPHTKRH